MTNKKVEEQQLHETQDYINSLKNADGSTDSECSFDKIKQGMYRFSKGKFTYNSI